MAQWVLKGFYYRIEFLNPYPCRNLSFFFEFSLEFVCGNCRLQIFGVCHWLSFFPFVFVKLGNLFWLNVRICS